ncbi:MAG: LEA type 2 family protein [Alphaproteobacteria bacterium]|nr:LEA type 2 family protein [Alphaproteobacteria bacterium]
MTIIRLVCLALALTFVGGGCASVDDVQPPRVNLVNIIPTGAGSGVFEQRFVVELRFSNFNDFDIPLDGLSFEMDVNGSHFATGLSNQPVTLPRLGSTVVSVDATASSIELFRQILNVARTGTVEYEIKGTALIGSVPQRTVPFVREGKLNLVPHPTGPDRLAPEKVSAIY